MLPRPVTYPATLSPSVPTRRSAFLEPHRLVSTAALEARMGAYRQAGVSVSLSDQHKRLTALRTDQACSHYALKGQRSGRFPLERAFNGCFRRVKAGPQPGFPRFKSTARGLRSFSTTQPRLKPPGQWPALSLQGMGRVRFKGQIAGPLLKARVVQPPLRAQRGR